MRRQRRCTGNHGTGRNITADDAAEADNHDVVLDHDVVVDEHHHDDPT
jgi:hypothetical protein